MTCARSRALRLVIAGCVVAACGTPGAPSDPEPSSTAVVGPEAPPEPAPQEESAETTAEYFPGIPSYPNGRFLCAQHVSGPRGHISWRGYASEDDLATVRAFYAARFPAGPVSFEPDGEGFRLRIEDDRVFSAHAAGSGHPTCEVEHGPSDRTYLVVSTMAR